MTTYEEYIEQIEKLMLLAKEARRQEIAQAVRDIEALMRRHGLGLKDFEDARGGRTLKGRGSVPPRFRDPRTGVTWTGRGRTPLWLIGKDKEQFRIKDDSSGGDAR